MFKFTMVGTESTGKYVGVATRQAQVGFRDLGNGSFRVRVEPVKRSVKALTPSFQGWKTGIGGNEFRFSKVVHGEDALREAIAHAFKAVTPGRVVASENCPEWVVEAAKAAKPETEAQERKRLISIIRSQKLPGANLAPRWSLATLRSKVG